MKATTKNLWAPIIKPRRGAEWVNWTCVRRTRRGAKTEYLRDIPETYHPEMLKNVRFAKVTINES